MGKRLEVTPVNMWAAMFFAVVTKFLTLYGAVMKKKTEIPEVVLKIRIGRFIIYFF